jgi:hypothetical protein
VQPIPGGEDLEDPAGEGAHTDAADEGRRRLLEEYVLDLAAMGGWDACDPKSGRKKLDRARHVLAKRHRVFPPVSAMVRAYRSLVESQRMPENPALRALLVRKEVRSWSGVLVVTLFTSPGNFSCPMDCHFCPNEVDENGTQVRAPCAPCAPDERAGADAAGAAPQVLPRSYLSTEPGCKRHPPRPRPAGASAPC